MSKSLSSLRTVQPKLRMIANGSSTVNIIRAEYCSALVVPSAGASRRFEPVRNKGAMPKPRSALRLAKRGRLGKANAPKDVAAHVFVQLAKPTDKVTGSGMKETARHGALATARVPLDKIGCLVGKTVRVELAETLVDPAPVVRDSSPPAPTRRDFGRPALHHDGKGVLVGIIDVQGFDFAHPDFRDAGGDTRFVAIWDQGGTNRAPPRGYDYGSELTGEILNRALRACGTAGAAATDLEPQSQQAPGSHGTHVASIAAGNRGVCPKADIAAVLISMAEGDAEGRRSFYDSTRLIHAVEYLIALAEQRNQPLTINVSLGTNGHAHDGSSVLCRWLDSLLTTPGRCLCAAAGNAGQERAEHEGDYGFIMGRIHTSGRVPARGLTADIGWLVVGNGVADISENELEIWYSSQDRFAVSVRPPGGDWIGPIEPQMFVENRELDDGTFVSIYNEVYQPSNGDNLIGIYLSPLLSRYGVAGVKGGEWTVRLHGREVRDGRYHGWIERDDPRDIGPIGAKEAWSFPSFFTETSNVDDSSISSLACSHFVIGVANLDEARDKINISSSQGPTRDGRSKPDLAAPGTDIVAAKAFSGSDDLWISMTGTSMASPFVTGVVGLMLAARPDLTAAQVRGILRRTARPLPGADYQWQDDAGFGIIQPAGAIEEAVGFSLTKDATR
ncbi:MAG: S8 family peptidase [Polyangiaceae bacterium]|nr:S8 family peptidase [Polyangiaceae bacterium]